MRFKGKILKGLICAFAAFSLLFGNICTFAMESTVSYATDDELEEYDEDYDEDFDDYEDDEEDEEDDDDDEEWDDEWELGTPSDVILNTITDAEIASITSANYDAAYDSGIGVMPTGDSEKFAFCLLGAVFSCVGLLYMIIKRKSY